MGDAQQPVTRIWDCQDFVKYSGVDWEKPLAKLGDDKEGIKQYIESKTARGYHQRLKTGDWCNPVFDLDDRCDSKEEAEEQTLTFCDYAETTIARYFGIKGRDAIMSRIASAGRHPRSM